MPKTAATRTCTYTVSTIPRPSRSTSSLDPGCGPEAVATAPVTTRAMQAGRPTQVTIRLNQRAPAGGARPSRRLQASSTAISASPSAASPSRKCVMTASGWRSRAMVMPPIGICAIATRKAPSAAHRPQPGEATRPARRQPGRQREHDPDEGDHAVTELDECVEALLRIRLGTAARPVLASEARAGQADERTRRDHDEEHETRCESDPEERPCRDRSSSSDGDGH